MLKRRCSFRFGGKPTNKINYPIRKRVPSRVGLFNKSRTDTVSELLRVVESSDVLLQTFLVAVPMDGRTATPYDFNPIPDEARERRSNDIRSAVDR